MPRQGVRSGPDTTVLVADDQEQFRDAVCELVAAVPGFVLVGVAASGEEAVAAVGSLSPELVLMDVRMRGWGASGPRARSRAATREWS
jgi:DNA-binding NarL/FixJ family response regulator